MRIKRIHIRGIWLVAALCIGLQGCGQAAPAPQVRAGIPTVPVSTQLAPTESSTVGPTAAASSAQSETPTITNPVDQPGERYSGPLTHEQQVKLTAAAQDFQAATPELAAGMAKQIGEESAASLDGPLVIAILEHAGLLPEPVNPHQLWMLDPVKDWQLARKAFPKEDFQWITRSLPIQPHDLDADPLYAGDVLYFSGRFGAYPERYILISRVDEQRRAYVTTTQEVPSGGYGIAESLLYDPLNRREGILGTVGGSQGSGRLLVWRLRDRRGESAFATRLNRVLDRGGRWNVLVKKVGGSVLFERDADATIHPASVIKIPLAMLAMQQLAQDPRGLEKALESGPPEAGRSFAQLLNASLVKSEEEATGDLEAFLFRTPGDAKMRAQLDAWGAVRTQIEPRRSTAREMALLLEGLYNRSLLAPQPSQLLMEYLGAVTSGDMARLWKLNGLLPAGSRIYNKRGTLTDPVLIVADAGIIQLPETCTSTHTCPGGRCQGVRCDQAYVVCLFGYPEGDGRDTYEDLDAAIGDFAVAWYQAQFTDNMLP